MTELLRELAPLLAKSLVLYTIIGSLTLWALLSGLRLWRATSIITGEFRAAARSLGSDADPIVFAAHYEATSVEIGRRSHLGAAWHRFSQSLIIPAGAGRPIVSTVEPQRYFDLTGLVRAAGSDLRYHAALPGLLVGAGLLVTFLGLAAALSSAGEVVAEGVDQVQRNAALRNLLNAASVKFVTSVAGLLLSILYALYRKKCLHRAEAAMAGFFMALQARLPLQTPAALQAAGNAILEKQYADVQRIGGEFFVNLGATLEREFGAGLEQHLGPLATAIDRLSAGLANQNEDAMQSMLRTFLERLEGAVGDSMRGTAATIDMLGTRLDGLQGALDAAAQRMGRAAEEMAAGMGRGTQAALGGITEQMGALVRTLREAAEESGRNNRAAGDDMTRRMGETATALTEAVAAFQRRMEDGAVEGIGRLAAPIEALLAQLRDLTESQRRAGDASADALAATIGRAAAALEMTAAKVADVLGGGATDASARLVAATEAMREDLRGVLERFGATLDDSGAALTRSAAAGGEALRDAATAFGSDLDSSAIRLREAGQAAGDALREGGQEARTGMAEAARTLAQGSGMLAERLAALGTESTNLAERSQALDRTLRDATLPLATAATDLRATADAARQALTPWRETAEVLRGSADSLLGATAALEATQRGAAELAERFGQAADRFAGLDDGLARTFIALRDGLSGYRQQVEQFVTGLDQGFAKSVHGLQAIAQSLEDTAEELAGERPRRPARMS
ncbi:MAG TPA: hypothetical protein VGM87_07815 [Roseomonas sp.]|jgi:hypothetical protein